MIHKSDLSTLRQKKNEHGLRRLAARLARGEVRAEAVMRAYLDRCAELDASIGAWAFLDEDVAIDAARRAERATIRGPLHGIPFGVKDVIDTCDMPTAYGSDLYSGFRPAADASCVALARLAGGVVMGKTTSTEFAGPAASRTRNPVNPLHTPGGSSSGSAAAVASGMAPVAFGTQTAGSVIRPASFTGCVGYKPSFGLIDCSGVKSLATSFDTVGLFAPDVDDARFFAAGVTARPTLASAPTPANLKIYLWRGVEWEAADGQTRAILQDTVRRLRHIGVPIGESAASEMQRQLRDVYSTIFFGDVSAAFASERLHALDRLRSETRTIIMRGDAVTADAYDEAQAVAKEARLAAAELFRDADALIVPAAVGEAPLNFEGTGDPICSIIWSLLHLPCISIPIGRGHQGLPIGMQIVGRPGGDAALLAIAAFVERALAQYGAADSWRS